MHEAITYFPGQDGTSYVLRNEIVAYMTTFPEDVPSLQPLLKQLDAHEDLFDRRNFHGHITGAGIVLSPDHQKVLLIHHRRFDRWQQPGGHAEPSDKTPLGAAWREVVEESGAHISCVMAVNAAPTPIHIGVHYIDPNPDRHELGHYHYDFRYVFEAADDFLKFQEVEVNDAVWVRLDDPRVSHIAVPLGRLKINI